MKHHIKTATSYISTHKKSFIPVVVIVIIIIAVPLIAWGVQAHKKSLAYQPIEACKLLSTKHAESLLGERVNNIEANKPIITGNVAMSKCGYTDLSETSMRVEALIVESGINPKGTAAITKQFKHNQTKQGNQTVENVGDRAFFDASIGALNVLKGREWLIISYGIGANPSTNDKSTLIKIARTFLSEMKSSINTTN